MNEEQLQELLSVYRHRQTMPALPRRSFAPLWSLAAAAALLIAIGAVWINSWHQGWRMLRSGERITKATRIERRGIGVVDIGANTLLRLEGGNRLSLERGTIHAKTVAPPGIFIVDTPRARAIDLGCEYTLTVAPNGEGVLRVTAGWVSLDNQSRTLVPHGASATIDAHGRLSPPVFDDASPQFKTAIARRDLRSALAFARRRDVITLLHLFKTAPPEQQQMIYERLNSLVPAPPGARRGWIEPWWPEAIKKKVSSLGQ
ncbi:MAG TPA: hypothetical protein VKU62_11230 [Thermoanaerobaculia bacterium]|nr:hypothetical protein [Thermoanaerobaculia bacterium]